jgi:Ras-related protein Rab-8A
MTTLVSKPSFDYQVKLILVGDTEVGKTCLLIRYTEDRFPEGQKATIGVDFKTAQRNIDNTETRLHLWDTSGQERFRSISVGYIRGAHCALVVFSMKDRKSFENVSVWVADLLERGVQDMDMALVANKCDGSSDEQEVTEEEAQICAESLKMPLVLASAKENLRVNEAFNMVITACVRRLNARKTEYEKKGFYADGRRITSAPTGVPLTKETSDNARKSNCC